ncbi:unnamed protein product [Triticum turgidum subsp. durum]|uniref:B box-type domain-containing protein n=1 Tax=Triticum turgidum subsp. durum TaxID=4567 RepID=A0A9R0Y580_TRITD|nr:unnamed protein product [Triticum turgidum subsp. durum]
MTFTRRNPIPNFQSNEPIVEKKALSRVFITSHLYETIELGNNLSTLNCKQRTELPQQHAGTIMVHSANRVASRHERVRVCETCESAPAVLACHADAAALCTACDAQVHSANPIAQRHQRVPVLPLPAVAIPAASGFAEAEASVTAHGDKEEGEEVDSWRLRRNSDDNNCANKIDRYYNLVGYNMYYNNITCDPRPEEQYRMQEQRVQNRYIEKQGCECVVPPQVVMASEQQESDYGTRGAGQAASVTAITSTYTASISNDVS